VLRITIRSKDWHSNNIYLAAENKNVSYEEDGKIQTLKGIFPPLFILTHLSLLFALLLLSAACRRLFVEQ
jgi:hypothetical protein